MRKDYCRNIISSKPLPIREGGCYGSTDFTMNMNKDELVGERPYIFPFICNLCRIISRLLTDVLYYCRFVDDMISIVDRLLIVGGATVSEHAIGCRH